jgi:predicted HAD superfamily Cof-like phosphohydrolase
MSNHKHPYDLVREFHSTFKLPDNEMPYLPNTKERNLRKKLLKEEYKEYLQAEEEDDLVEIADALADQIYIICGTALSYGIPLDKIFTEVHRSNMTKLDENGKPVVRADGKIIKGPKFEHPRVEEILIQHGWEPY